MEHDGPCHRGHVPVEQPRDHLRRILFRYRRKPGDVGKKDRGLNRDPSELEPIGVGEHRLKHRGREVVRKGPLDLLLLPFGMEVGVGAEGGVREPEGEDEGENRDPVSVTIEQDEGGSRKSETRGGREDGAEERPPAKLQQARKGADQQDEHGPLRGSHAHDELSREEIVHHIRMHLDPAHKAVLCRCQQQKRCRKVVGRALLRFDSRGGRPSHDHDLSPEDLLRKVSIRFERLIIGNRQIAVRGRCIGNVGIFRSRGDRPPGRRDKRLGEQSFRSRSARHPPDHIIPVEGKGNDSRSDVPFQGGDWFDHHPPLEMPSLRGAHLRCEDGIADRSQGLGKSPVFIGA